MTGLYECAKKATLVAGVMAVSMSVVVFLCWLASFIPDWVEDRYGENAGIVSMVGIVIVLFWFVVLLICLVGGLK